MSDDDPFERLDDVEREGDPFEQLDDEATAGADGDERADDADDGSAGPDGSPQRDGDAEPTLPDDPFGEFDRDDAATADREDPAVDPFADVPDRDGDPFGGGESAFEQVDVGEIDADAVWESIDDDREPEVPEESRYAEVSKHAYCEQCPFFSEPPEAHCTHETAEIVEYLDMDRVRLFDCPVVAEREDLE
ncbi:MULTISPECIES: hypothetical protein [Halomicrobium]|uniref:DUF8135 domain-containing protein n=2 Tax=Halomicrobium mukohataei TaxID=57705 RepID=C7P300_HALMD|nr:MULTISPECIES: hypothetical protein [Halomicrobium]ACV47472.1 conserved hypothetical protein [Halomicrobium mukohataei DSM 12286]QCD65936.1 hypothetical protein E5139_09915 [Halomicrobium mukohataei]QFR20741.1 hypothetical protein GBQ70_09910 [Halomicrobium sp. ZPS1]